MTCFPHTISPAFSILLCSLTKSICLWKGKNEAAIFLLWLWLEVWKDPDADENWDTCKSKRSFCSLLNWIYETKCFKFNQIIAGIWAADFPLMNDVKFFQKTRNIVHFLVVIYGMYFLSFICLKMIHILCIFLYRMGTLYVNFTLHFYSWR